MTIFSKIMTTMMIGTLSLISVLILTAQITTWRMSSSSSSSSLEATQTQEKNSIIPNTNNTRLLSFSSSDPIIYCHTSGHIEISSRTTQRLGIASSGVLCTLTRVNKDANEVIPVGRSYNNNQWENVAGPYKNLSYNCNDHDNFCEVTIPEILKDGDTFHLTGFERQRPISKRDEAARFFEQASFGVTESDLEKLVAETRSNPNDSSDSSSSNNLLPYFAKWIHDQAYKVQPTSHRAVWRENLSPIYEDYNREGRPTMPCERGSIWRSSTFHYQDRYKELVVKKKNGRFAFKIDGKLRSMVKEFAFADDPDSNIDLSKPFKICKSTSGLSELVSLEYNKKCRELAGGNPPISINGMKNEPKTLRIKDTEEIVTVEGKVKIELIKAKSVIQDDICNQDSYDDHVFTTFYNGKNEQVLVFEPRLVLQENALESPLHMEGGH
jgi:hypothetical protein